MGWRIDHARSKGVPIQDTIDSLSAHLLKQRQHLRDNPRSLDASKPPERYDLAVEQTSTATGTRWKTLGQLPNGMGEITVRASTWDAARNKQSLRSLLEQRYRAELASALQRAGLYAADLDGRRAAIKVALDSSINVVDMDLAGLV